MEYGKRINPERSLRTPKGIKGTRQKVIVTHNPSEIDQNQELLVRFPNLGSDDVIIPGTANLSFNIELTSTVDANRTLVSNIGRAIIKKLSVKFEGNEIMSVDDFDIFACYRDLWKTKSEKRNAIHQGIISTDGCMENCIKLRINAGNKDATNTHDKAIADAYRKKFIIPLDFEMLDSASPYIYMGFYCILIFLVFKGFLLISNGCEIFALSIHICSGCNCISKVLCIVYVVMWCLFLIVSDFGDQFWGSNYLNVNDKNVDFS